MAIFSLDGVNGQIDVYYDKIVISRKGFIGFMSQGLTGEKIIPMNSINSVQFRAGGPFVNGFIQFAVNGGLEKQGGVIAATKDENTIMLRMGEQSELGRKIKDYVERRIIELSKPNETVVQTISPADEIIKYKKLLDEGILTQEEFDAKKKQLLGI